MFPTLVLFGVIGVPLSDAMVDHLVSTRTVVVTRQVMLEVVVYKGDPLGSKEAGTLEVLARPTITLTHKQTGFFQVGGEGQGGIVIRATPCLRLDGKIDMGCDTQISTPKIHSSIRLSGGQFAEGVDTVACQTKVALTPGKSHKVRMAAKSIEDQTWMELRATVVEDPRAVFAAEAAKMTWTVTDTQTVNGIKLIAVPVAPAVRTMTPTFLQARPSVLPASYIVPPPMPTVMPTVMPTPTAPQAMPQITPPTSVSK